MNLLLAAALMGVQQPIPVLIERITEKDPVAAFQAIRDLADLDAAHRPEILKGAAKLPEFYRNALAAELERLPVRRITMPAASRTCSDHLRELERVSGMKMKLRPESHHLVDGKEQGPVELGLENSPVLRALVDICRPGTRYPWFNAISGEVHVEPGGILFFGLGGRGEVLYIHGTSWKKRVDFGKSPAWIASIGFSALVGNPSWILEWTDLRIVEAIGEKVPLREARVEDHATRYGREEFPPPDPMYGAASFSLGVEVPKDAEAIKKLQVSGTACVAVRTRSLEVTLDEKGNGASEAEGWRASVISVEPAPIRNSRIKMRIRPKGVSLEELLKRPCLAQAVFGSHTVYPRVSRIRSVEGEIEILLTGYAPVKDDESITGPIPQRIRLMVAESVESRRIFAEFRDIPLK